MPAATDTPKPKTKAVRAKQKVVTQKTYVPDLVWVRALDEDVYSGNMIHRGGLKSKNGIGEVFQMDTATMRKWPLSDKRHKKTNELLEQPHEQYAQMDEPPLVETDRGIFEVPPTVELVDPDTIDPAEMVPEGHKSQFRDETHVVV